jgi:hypothetical protein
VNIYLLVEKPVLSGRATADLEEILLNLEITFSLKVRHNTVSILVCFFSNEANLGLGGYPPFIT